MSTPSLRLTDYLRHIQQAIERIERYTEEIDLENFLDDDLVQDAVIRNVEIIGEASHRILERVPEFAAAHPELPLSAAYQMRNAVAHGYLDVDMVVVWRTVVNDLPPLHERIARLLADVV